MFKSSDLASNGHYFTSYQTHSDEKSDQSSYKLTWPLRLMDPPPVVSSAHYLWVHDWVNHLFTQSGSASRLQLSKVPNWTNALTAETDPDIRWHRSFKSSSCVHGQSFILCCTRVRLSDEVIWLRWNQISIYIVFVCRSCWLSTLLESLLQHLAVFCCLVQQIKTKRFSLVLMQTIPHKSKVFRVFSW